MHSRDGSTHAAHRLLRRIFDGQAQTDGFPVRQRNQGFTLIELMIVVAIIGILAATSITTFRLFQLRTKMSEARVNVKAIATAENAYFAEFGTYVGALSTPGGPLTAFKRVWVGGGAVAFDVIGFLPEGDVHFNYGVDVNGAGSAFTVGAVADLDQDGVTSDLGYVHRPPGASAAALGVGSTIALGCIGAGVYDTANPLGLFDTVGVCTLLDGRSEF